MSRSRIFGLTWLLAIVLGVSAPANPPAVIPPGGSALRHGETPAAPTTYVPARAPHPQAVLPDRSSHSGHAAPSADALQSRADAAQLFYGQVGVSPCRAGGLARSPRHGFPRFPTGPPSPA